MTLLALVAVLIVVGVCLWGVQQIPMDATVRTIIRVVVIVVLVLWLVGNALGDSGWNPRVW